MAHIRSIRLRQLHGQLGDIAYELTRVQFASLSPSESWSPAINAYLCSRQITVCVDLAGVEVSGLNLEVEPTRLLIRGRREAPEPAGDQDKAVQVLAMEIDYGPFEREVPLPAPVDTRAVRAEQRQGMIWVYLPLLGNA